MKLQAFKFTGSAKVRSVVLFLFLFLFSICSQAQLILQVDLGPLGAVPSTNRQVAWQQISPFQGNLNYVISDPVNGQVFITNPPVGPNLQVLYPMQFTIQSPPGQRIQFQVTMLPGDAGTVDASNRLTNPGPTFPAGQMAWSVATSEGRYAVSTNQVGVYATQSQVTNIANSAYSNNPAEYIQASTLTTITNLIVTNSQGNVIITSNSLITTINTLGTQVTNSVISSTNEIGLSTGLSAFAPTNQFDISGAALAATNSMGRSTGLAAFALTNQFDSSGAAVAVTNNIGVTSGLAAFTPTNQYDIAGAAQKATNALNTGAFASTNQFDIANAALNATNGIGLSSGLAAFASTNQFASTASGQSSTNNIGISSGLSAFVPTNQFDIAGAAQAVTNSIGRNTGLSAFASTNQFDYNGAAQAATNSLGNAARVNTNFFDLAGTAQNSTNGLWGDILNYYPYAPAIVTNGDIAGITLYGEIFLLGKTIFSSDNGAQFQGPLYDASDNSGGAGQILMANGFGVLWENPPTNQFATTNQLYGYADTNGAAASVYQAATNYAAQSIQSATNIAYDFVSDTNGQSLNQTIINAMVQNNLMFGVWTDFQASASIIGIKGAAIGSANGPYDGFSPSWTNFLNSAFTVVLSGGNYYLQSNGVSLYASITGTGAWTVVNPYGVAPAPFGVNPGQLFHVNNLKFVGNVDATNLTAQWNNSIASAGLNATQSNSIINLIIAYAASPTNGINSNEVAAIIVSYGYATTNQLNSQFTTLSNLTESVSGVTTNQVFTISAAVAAPIANNTQLGGILFGTPTNAFFNSAGTDSVQSIASALIGSSVGIATNNGTGFNTTLNGTTVLNNNNLSVTYVFSNRNPSMTASNAPNGYAWASGDDPDFGNQANAWQAFAGSGQSWTASGDSISTVSLYYDFPSPITINTLSGAFISNISPYEDVTLLWSSNSIVWNNVATYDFPHLGGYSTFALGTNITAQYFQFDYPSDGGGTTASNLVLSSGAFYGNVFNSGTNAIVLNATNGVDIDGPVNSTGGYYINGVPFNIAAVSPPQNIGLASLYVTNGGTNATCDGPYYTSSSVTFIFTNTSGWTIAPVALGNPPYTDFPYVLYYPAGNVSSATLLFTNLLLTGTYNTYIGGNTNTPLVSYAENALPFSPTNYLAAGPGGNTDGGLLTNLNLAGSSEFSIVTLINGTNMVAARWFNTNYAPTLTYYSLDGTVSSLFLKESEWSQTNYFTIRSANSADTNQVGYKQ